MLLEGRQVRDAKVGRILLWEGRVSRSRLISEFGLSPIRASEWLRDFREAHPQWVTWDSKLRADVATAKAYSDAERAAHAAQPNSISAMLVPHALSAPGTQLPVSWEFDHASPRTFSRLNLAIADRRRVSFQYCSMENPEPHERTIEPHTLVKAGRRWHVRGHCLEREDFRDFVVGRMSKVKLLDESSAANVEADVAWTTVRQLRIVAHPALTPAQQRVVRNEYFNGAAGRVESCRAALLGYLVQEIRAATNPDRQRPPEYQLAVENTKECRQWLFMT
jgi:predicted DNA-binding transcriptional regulator YafY